MSAALQQRVQHKVVAARAEKGAQPNTNVFTLSTDKPDRDGDRLNQGGWNLTAYRQNPVVLYGHDHKSLPIGKCTDIRVVGGKLKGTVEWPPAGVHPFADTVHALVDGGFLNAASVGFRARHMELNQHGGHDISEPELCEWSIVPIPSNTDAQLERGIDQVRYKSWLGHSGRQNKEDSMKTFEDDDVVLEISDDVWRKNTDDDFAAMCARMLAAYEEMTSQKFRELMGRQLATLGPLGTIADLVRGLQAAGVYTEPKSYDIDERQVARLIAEVIAETTGTQVRAAFNTVLGRLD